MLRQGECTCRLCRLLAITKIINWEWIYGNWLYKPRYYYILIFYISVISYILYNEHIHKSINVHSNIYINTNIQHLHFNQFSKIKCTKN